MSCGIYKIVVAGTARVYVGSSVNIDKRFTSHLESLEAGEHHSHKLQSYYNDNEGVEIRCEILEKCLETILPDREAYYIKKLDSVNKGFNVSQSTHRFYKRFRVMVQLENLNEQKERLLKIDNDTLSKLSFQGFTTRATTLDESMKRVANVCRRFEDFCEMHNGKTNVLRIHAGFPKDTAIPLSSWVLYDSMVTNSEWKPGCTIIDVIDRLLSMEIV